MTGARIRRHGQVNHTPGGSDPIAAGPYHNVGDPGEPDFVNGANAAPSAQVPNPVPMRFRITVGEPNLVAADGTILAYSEHQLEIEGDVTNVQIGDTVFVLPPKYRKNRDLPCNSHDDMGNYVACRLLSSGEFLYGVP